MRAHNLITCANIYRISIDDHNSEKLFEPSMEHEGVIELCLRKNIRRDYFQAAHRGHLHSCRFRKLDPRVSIV
jgi:hypothetical protein